MHPSEFALLHTAARVVMTEDDNREVLAMVINNGTCLDALGVDTIDSLLHVDKVALALELKNAALVAGEEIETIFKSRVMTIMAECGIVEATQKDWTNTLKVPDAIQWNDRRFIPVLPWIVDFPEDGGTGASMFRTQIKARLTAFTNYVSNPETSLKHDVEELSAEFSAIGTELPFKLFAVVLPNVSPCITPLPYPNVTIAHTDLDRNTITSELDSFVKTIAFSMDEDKVIFAKIRDILGQLPKTLHKLNLQTPQNAEQYSRQLDIVLDNISVILNKAKQNIELCVSFEEFLNKLA